MVKIAFYKAFQPKATLLDVAIATATFGKYCHYELVFPNGMCFSISPREKTARFKAIDLNPKKWDVFELKNHNADTIFKEANKLLGYKYDYIGALFSAVPKVHIEKPNKLFCSEACGLLLGVKHPYKYSPNELAKLIRGGDI